MQIYFKSERLRKCCTTFQQAQREWGERRAKIIFNRLSQLRAVNQLGDMRYMPGDCHEYRHLRDYRLTLDLDGGWRLVFRPAAEPAPTLEDKVSLDWSKVEEIVIIGVENPHG